MAIEKGATEIADSEDDPMTSSPGVIPDEAADKLCAMARIPSQERQDALHGADCLHQAFAQRNANAASCSAEGLGGDAQIDDASKIDQTNMTPQDLNTVQEEGAINELGHHDLSSHSELRSSNLAFMTGAISDESNVMLVQALPRMESQPGEEVPGRKADTGIQQDRSNQATKDEPPKQSDMRAVESAVVEDVENYSEADYQEQLCIASSNSPARKEQAATENIHPIILGTQSKAPSTSEQHPLDANVDVEASDGFRPLSQGYTTHGSLFQESSNNGSQAAGHSSAHGYPNENAAHTPIAFTATPIGTTSVDSAADASVDRVGNHAVPNLSSGAEQHDARSPGTTLCNPQIDTDTSGTTMSARETSSMIDHKQTLLRDSTEQHLAVAETALSKKSADEDSVASSPTTEPATHDQSHTGARCMTSPPQTPPLKTAQETTLDEMRAQKAALLASLGALPAIQVLIEEHALSDAGLDDANDVPTETDIMAAANKIVKEHIKLLHEYNELKDMGQGLMGLIADQRGARIVEVQEEFGIDAAD
ncbi:hypothetical protein GT037_009117 [Alternaria burnsii]|uniref:Swi5-domain-containing protein n=1 Tax=Alternaria burnsii TaxID=1187904 RepID=A0A8H7EC67_9PLEO|nr:uncharacterized protein GT037_009117 [Alternaria burnsii]KAF7672616.1 hypothetical protein GT037_009117 [Alternaria burnsii]